MDVVYPPKAPSGSDIFQSGGFGELLIGTLGNQDDYVVIDSDDSDAVPQIESGLRNDASVAGKSGGASAVRNGSKSMAGSSLAPREVPAVSSASSHGRREQHGARSQGSGGRSSRSIILGRSLPQPISGPDVSPKVSDGAVPKAFNEESSKRSIPKELQTQMSIKTNSARKPPSVGLSRSLSKSVERNDEDGLRSRERDAQTIVKRKASDIEPSTSTSPAKRAKVQGNPSDATDVVRQSNKAEEPQPRGVSLSMRKGTSDEDRDTALRASGILRERRNARRLLLADETDDDTHDEPQRTGNQKSDVKSRKSSRVKVTVSRKKDSDASGLAKIGAAGSDKQLLEKQRQPGENGGVPFRSAFSLNAKKRTHPPVSGDNKSHAGARYGTHSEEIWVTCTKCKKVRKVNADVNLKKSIWCCENDPKYASCSAAQVPGDELEVRPESQARTEGPLVLIRTQSKDEDIDIARRNMVWVKLQVDGEELFWPGLQVTRFPPAIQKKVDAFIEEGKGQTKVIRLFHPREDVDEFQIVKRSATKPYHQTSLSYKYSSSHSDFIAAIAAAEEFYAQPDTSMGGFSQFANEGPDPNATADDAGCRVEDTPHEGAESNELEFEDAETPGDDPQGSQPQTDNEIETFEDVEVNQVPVEEGVDGLSPEAGNGSGLSNKRDDLQCSQSRADKGKRTLEVEEVVQVPTEQGKVQNSPEARNDIGRIGVSGDPQCAQPQAAKGRVGLEDEAARQGSVEHEEDALIPKAGDMIKSSDKRDDPSQADKVKVGPKTETPVEQGSDGVEARERTRGSDASGLEELHGSGEKLVLDLKILPSRRLVSYDGTTKRLLFQDGAAVSVDTDSLRKELGISSTGRTLHECIHAVGQRTIRGKFPKDAKSSSGLKFSALDPSDSFAKRLRDTWLREYKDEPMPELLRTRFVAGCIMEERGEPVNWAQELFRTIRLELKEVSVGSRESLSPVVLNSILRLLERQVGQAPLPNFKAVKQETPMDNTEHDIYCQQCNKSGEILCCDGSGCRKTYHLKCLNPPLEEPPSGAFLCPGCLADASKPPGVEVGSSSVVKHGINLHANDVSRQEPQGVSESPTLVGKIDSLQRPASVISRTNLEVGMVTTEAAGELLSSKNDGKLCVSGADTVARIDTNRGDIALVASNLTEGAVHQLPASNAHGTEHTALKDTNVVEDLRVTNMVADAAVSEEPQIRSTPRLVVDSLPTKKHVLSEARQKTQAVPGNASLRIDLGTIKASPSGLRRNGLQELGGGSRNVQVGSSPSCIPVTDNGAIQLVNREERSGNRVGSSLLRSSGLPGQRRDGSESELEEGEISPSDQANASNKAADNSISKRTDISPPLTTQDIPSGVELPREEDEFPSSDDHNSICEGCEVGGELMYVTPASLTSTPSSPLMLCDGKGCKVVYHKECLNPPLQTVPAGEWYCPECEKGKVEKIWSVRKACSVVRSRTGTKNSGARGSGGSQGDQHNSEDDAHDDMPLGARFGNSSQRPDGQVAVNEPGKASGSCAIIANTNLKDDNVEYLVQWKSRSHAHDKWVSEKELEKIAPKELARFKKLLHEGQENYDSEWAEPERVIQKRLTRVSLRQRGSALDKEKASSGQNAETEWFVKWKGLGYEYCTWEPADAGVLATPRGIELIHEYESWAKAAKQRASKESQDQAQKLIRLPMKDLATQPEWAIRPELLPLQLEALNKLRRLWHSRMNGILVYEASQEKIVMTITFFLSLVEDYRVVRPILVVVPKSLIQNWEHELYQWAPKLYIVNYASKTEEARGIIRRTEFSLFSEPFKPQIVLTTFEIINCDMDHLKKVDWEALIIDEGRRQRLQKSHQKSYRPFSQIKSTFRLLLLSEPLKSNVEELVQFVNFLEPRKSVFSHGDDMTKVAELQRRLTGRVLEYIPENRLTEYWVPVEMTPVQLDQYYNLLVRHYPTLSGNNRDHQIQEVVIKLRQSCNHPLLADPALNSMRTDLTPKEILDYHIEISGKMRLLHLMMPIFKAANWRVLIFSQETKQLDILERYMTQSHGSDSYERVDSDLATKTKEAAIQRFNAEGSKRFVLLLKTGVRISFKNVQFLLLYDSDLNPAIDMQRLREIHNEGEASSKPLPVLRLYTHLTVEESTLILFRDKQLPPNRANVNAKICQKLLTWGASKIFDRYDNDNNGPTGSLYRPKGAKVCPKAKLKQVYNPEVVQKLLEALLCQEECSKLEGDELLEAILVPRDEPASLFAESEHPINMIMGDSAEAFWASSLKWRHDVWQAKEVTMLGKGQRGKKRITYDEDAMATAVYSKAQFSEESERKRPRRRKASSEEEQEGVAGPSAQVSVQPRPPSLPSSLPTDSISLQVNTASPSNVSDTEQLQGSSAGSALPRIEALGPTQGPVNHDHASNRKAGSEAVCDSTEMFWESLPSVCTALELPGPVIDRVHALLKHFMQSQKNFRKGRATYEIIAIELAVVWVAAMQLNHAIDKMTCIKKVEDCILGTEFENRPQLMGPLYNRVVGICASFEPPPAPLTVVSTTPQPLLVPEISSPGASVQNHPPRANLEPSSGNVSVQATVGEPPACNDPLVGSQETGQQVEVPSPVILSSAPLPVQATVPTDGAPAVEDSPVAHTVDEPVLESDSEVVLVGADPRFVPEDPVDTFIDQSRPFVPDPDGRLVSGASVVEQGKGWVLVDPTPDVRVEEDVPVANVATPASKSSTAARSVGSVPLHAESLQRGGEAISATLSAPLEVPGISISELPVETTQPLNQTQVPPTQNIGPARQNEQEPATQNEQAATDTPARLKERAHQDRNFIIHGQMKECAGSKSRAHRRLEELKRRYDASCCQPVRDPSVLKGLEDLYNSQKKTLERLNQTEFHALDTRQRAHRDNLRELYNKLTSSATGEGASLDVRKIELEIQKIKGHYSQSNQPPLNPSPLQGYSLNQGPASRTTPPTRRSPSTTEAPPTSTVQMGGGSRVAQSLASANPAENQQRQHVGRSSSPAVPAATSSQQQRGPSVQPSPQQRGHSVQPVTAVGSPNSQRPATEVVSTAAMQYTGVQPRGQAQRSNAPVHPGPTPNLQRGAAVVSRSSSAPALVPVVPPGVGHLTRPSAPTSASTSAPASVMPPAGNATGHVYPDVLLREKEKLNKELEKAKVAYEAESQRIKAEYDKEAEILHKRYEAFLIEQHLSYTKRQHQVQQNIVKVEWNRQLAEALKLREELAARAAVFAGLSSQTAVQPVANQQAPQQIPGRPQSGATAATPVPGNTSRVTTNAGNANPGIASVIMHPPGTSSTRVSTTPVQHPPRYGVPAAPQQESPRYATPAAPQQESPRYGMHTAPRSSMSGAMAVLAASGTAGTPGSNASAGILRASVFTPSPEPMNSDAGAGSPRPRTSGLSPPGVVVPVSPPPFQDPILAIIRNSVPSLDPVVIPQEDPVVPPVAVPPMTPVVIPTVGMGSFTNAQSSGPANPLPAGVESQIARSAEAAAPDHQIEPGAQSDMPDITIEGVDVRLGTVHLSSGPQEQPVANVAVSRLPNVAVSRPPNVPVSRPPSLIYLSDSDDE